MDKMAERPLIQQGIEASRQLPDHNRVRPSSFKVNKWDYVDRPIGALKGGIGRIIRTFKEGGVSKQEAKQIGLRAATVAVTGATVVGALHLGTKPAAGQEIVVSDARPAPKMDAVDPRRANPVSVKQEVPIVEDGGSAIDSGTIPPPGLGEQGQGQPKDGDEALAADPGVSAGEASTTIEAPAGDDSLRAAIEARMKANPADAVFEKDYHGQNPESEIAGAHLYQQIIAQLEEVGGPAKDTAAFFRGFIKAPINLLPGTNPKVTNLVVLRSPDRETLRNEFPFAANAPFSVFVGVRGDDSPNRPQSVVQLYFIVIVNPDNQFGDMGADNAWLSLEAMQVKKQIELTQEALNKDNNLGKLTNQLPREERLDLVRSINGATQSIASGLSDDALKDSVPKLLEIQTSGKALFVDPSLAKLLDDYGHIKPSNGN